MDIYGAHTAERVCFHILVQQFIGIQFGTVGRQKENPDLLTVSEQGLRDGAPLDMLQFLQSVDALPMKMRAHSR